MTAADLASSLPGSAISPAKRRRARAMTVVWRVLTWNVQHASPQRAAQQAAWLAESDADVLVLTEVSGYDGGARLAEALLRWGYSTHASGTGGRDYRVLLAARGMTLEPVPLRCPAYLRHRCLAARVAVRGSKVAVGVVGLYVPSRGGPQGRNVAKRDFQDAVIAMLPGLPSAFPPAGGPLMVAGDLNVVEPGHRPHHAVFGQWEYNFYRAFAAGGLDDAFRHLHPAADDHSWHGRHGAGYRFDHIFCSRPYLAALTDVRYLHQPRLAGLSDHAAMVAALTLDTGEDRSTS